MLLEGTCQKRYAKKLGIICKQQIKLKTNPLLELNIKSFRCAKKSLIFSNFYFWISYVALLHLLPKGTTCIQKF